MTPDELGPAFDGKKVHLPLLSQINGKPFGRPNAGVDMTFDFPTLIAHAVKTRPLMGGAIIGSGTVSNRDADGGPGKPVPDGGVGYSCLAEIRTVETILHGAPKTPYLNFGDRVRIEMNDAQGRSIFGAIDHEVVQGLTTPEGWAAPRSPTARAQVTSALHAKLGWCGFSPVLALIDGLPRQERPAIKGEGIMNRYYIPALGSLYASLDRYMLPMLRIVLGVILIPHGCQKLFGMVRRRGLHPLHADLRRHRLQARLVLGDAGGADRAGRRADAGVRLLHPLRRARRRDLHDQRGVVHLGQGLLLDRGRLASSRSCCSPWRWCS